MMTLIQALILGLIQGITEFLPISSSTHLSIAKQLMGIEPSTWMVYFDLVCHFGTLFAVMTVLWRDVFRVLTNLRSIALFTVALLPLVPGYFLFKPLRILLAPHAGIFLFFTAALMFVASSRFVMAKATGCNSISLEKKPMQSDWRDALWIGMFQSFALLPGISRSASTISAARFLGWDWKEAARFSFLLSIPTILGGSMVETIHASGAIAEIPWKMCAVAFGASFLMGIGSVRLLFWILNKGSLRPFAWYCLGVGLLSLYWLR